MSRTVTLVGFAVLVAAALAVEVVARRRRGVPTLGAVADAVTRRVAVRVVLLAGWLWLGWHLFVRVAR